MAGPVPQGATRPAYPQVYRMDETTTDLHIKMLVHGESGIGKTWLALELARYFETLLVFSERSRSAIKSHPHFSEIRKKLHIMDCHSWSDVMYCKDYAAANLASFQWVVFDSLTDIGKRCADDVAEGKDDKKEADTLSKRDWGKVSFRMQKFTREVRDLYTNVLFIALSTGVPNDLTGEVKFYPSLTGKLKEEMSPLMDTTGYMYPYDNSGEISRGVLFTTSPIAIAKDRNNKLKNEPADMTLILRKLGLIQ